MYNRGQGIAIVALLLTACGGDDLCIAEPQHAVIVRVYDAALDNRITQIVRGVIQQGTYVDSLARYSFDDAGTESLAAGPGRHGVFEMRLEAPGYKPWVKQDVLVGAGRCGTITRHLVVEMEPEQ